MVGESMRGITLVAALAALGAVPGAAGAACSVQRIVELPVTMANGYQPTVTAKINGAEARFIADSGAFYSLISPGMAAAANLRPEPAPPGFRLYGLGGDSSASVATVKEFTLAGVPLRNIQFLVGGSDFGEAGLIGQNVLGLADVEYDLPHGAIRLFRSRDCGKTILAYWVDKRGIFSLLKILPLEEARQQTVGTVYVNGEPLRAAFDTGAGRTLLSRKAADRVGVKPGDPGVIETGAARGLGRRLSRSWTAPFKTVKIGDEEVRRVRLFIADTDLGDTDMLIGADFFISHRVYVDNAAHRMFFTYTGGKVFDSDARRDGETTAAAPAVAAEGEPKDADAFSRRGAVFLAQRDFARAIADFSRAIELAPKDSRFLLQRAEAYIRSGRRALGAADLNRAVETDPANIPARLHRAQLRLSIAEREGALADVEAAAKAVTGPTNERLQIANLYGALDLHDRQVAQLDAWIAAHPEDSELPSALNSRCWARALWGRDLEKALSDCNAALRRRPGIGAFLDSRGLVRLRLGDYDRAIQDYDAALQADPKMAWSLYGRGLARRHKGLASQAEADLNAAAAIAPEIAERARKAGIE
jgi:tetratricopeptide (TPR) repeat protein